MQIILLWMTGALVIGQLFKYLSLPPLVGFILAGYIFSVFGYHDTNSYLSIPSEIGVELLLFSIGLKIKPSAFLNIELIIVVLLHTIFITIVYFFLSSINLSLELKIIICIALSFSSTVIATKSLEDRNELTSFHGRISLLIIIFQDIIALFLLGYIESDSLTYKSFYLLLIPLSVPLLKYILEKTESDAELQLIATLVIALFLGSYLFKYLGLTGEIGALVMGILLSNYKSAYNLSEKIWSIREILLLSFFISIGMQITLDANVLGILTILMSLLVIKSLILFFLLIFFKLRAYTSFLIAVSLSTYSEFSLIVLSLVTKNVSLEPMIVSGLIVSVCTSFILAAILNKYAHQIYERSESFFIRFERKTRHPDEEPHTCGDAEVMIIGMGRFGNAIFDNLLQNNIKTVGFDSDTDLITNLLNENKRVTFADAEDPGFWSQLRFGKLKSIILAIPEYEAQIWSTKQARKHGFEGDIIIPSRSKEDISILENYGANHIYDAYEAAALGVTKDLINKHNEKS